MGHTTVGICTIAVLGMSGWMSDLDALDFAESGLQDASSDVVPKHPLHQVQPVVRIMPLLWIRLHRYTNAVR